MADQPSTDATRIELFGWTETSVESRRFASLGEATAALGAYRCAWIDLEGVSLADVALHLEGVIALSPLACDTLIEGVRRAGADDFGEVTILTMRAYERLSVVEFIDILVAPRLVLTIQEKVGGDPFDGVRDRLRNRSQHLQRADENVMMLLLGRAICEAYRPVLTEYNESLERFERALVRRPDSSMLDRIHEHRRQLLFLRQGLAPLREALGHIQAALAQREPRPAAGEGGHLHARITAIRELQDEIGALVPGMKADLVLHDTDRPEWRPLLNVMNQLVWSADGRGVHTVLVDGKVVVEDGHCTPIDEERMWAEAQRMGESITARSGLPDKAKFPTW